MAESLLRIHDLKKSFGERKVLDGVSFEVARGEVLGLMGGSGTGKSTILKLIIGLIKPDSGEIWFEDHEITCLSERSLARLRPRIGYVFQNGALFDSMTVEENLRYPLEKRSGMNEEEIAERVLERLRNVELDGTQELFPSELSGGMIKRAGLARATMLSPPLILFDEPTAGLDPRNIRHFIEMFRKIRKTRELSGIFISHDAAATLSVCNRVAILSEGRVHAIESSAKIRASQDPIVQSFIQTEYVENEQAS